MRNAEFQLLGTLTPDSGMLASRVAVVQARVDEPAQQAVDVREASAIRWLHIRDLRHWVAQGRIEDGISLAALTLANALGRLPPT